MKRKKRRRRRKSGCGCFGCLIPFLLMIGLAASVFWLGIGAIWGRVRTPDFRASEVRVNEDIPASAWAEDETYRSIMIFGVDSRDQDPIKYGALADANILVTIHRETGEISMTSFYRDTCMETPDGQYQKLTEIYSNYGPQGAMETLNRNYDLHVREFVTVTWGAVAEAINGIGGIDVEITAEEARSEKGINKYIDEVIKSTGIPSEYVREDISEEGQIVHLDGVQAVTFCRLRKGLGDDYQRTVRQRMVVDAAFRRAKKKPLRAAYTAYQVLPLIASNLKTRDLKDMASHIADYEMGDNYGFPRDKRDDNMFVYPDSVSTNSRWLHETVYRNRDYHTSYTVDRIDKNVKARMQENAQQE